LLRTGGLSPSKATTFARQIAETFPDGELHRSAYEDIINTLSGPDPDDLVHLAAAIAGEADVVVTFNVGDFASATAPAGVRVPLVMHPDDYFSAVVDEGLRADLLDIIVGMALRRKSPPMTWQQLVDRLANVGVPRTIGKLAA
jgi:hypothetical protein